MSTQLSVALCTDNDAFYENPGYETARILRRLADKFESEVVALGEHGNLRDVNGNTTGTWSLDADDGS